MRALIKFQMTFVVDTSTSIMREISYNRPADTEIIMTLIDARSLVIDMQLLVDVSSKSS